jgi:hypothetical protein
LIALKKKINKKKFDNILIKKKKNFLIKRIKKKRENYQIKMED